MQAQGKIADRQGAGFENWDLEGSLPELDLYEVRYSRGFMQTSFADVVGKLGEHWLPFFEKLGAPCTGFSLSRGFAFPDDIGRVVPVKVNGEVAVLGLDDASADVVLRLFDSALDDSVEDIVLEYLERRFLSSLMMSWTLGAGLDASYLPADAVDAVEIIGVLSLHLSLGGNPVTFHLGLGPRILESLDLHERSRIAQSALADQVTSGSEDTVELTMELMQFSVEPAMLVDYMRAGTVISLEVPAEPKVCVLVNGAPWAIRFSCSI